MVVHAKLRDSHGLDSETLIYSTQNRGNVISTNERISTVNNDNKINDRIYSLKQIVSGIWFGDVCRPA